MLFARYSYSLLKSVPACIAGRKKKEQHDANQASAGLNPAYPYGAANPVSISSTTTQFSISIIFPALTLDETHEVERGHCESVLLPLAA